MSDSKSLLHKDNIIHVRALYTIIPCTVLYYISMLHIFNWPDYVIMHISLVSGPKPTLQAMLVDLSVSEVGSDWFVLGIALGVPIGKMRSIEVSYLKEGVKRCMVEMLQYWLDTTPAACWQQVSAALEQVDLITLASRVKQKYLWDNPEGVCVCVCACACVCVCVCVCKWVFTTTVCSDDRYSVYIVICFVKLITIDTVHIHNVGEHVQTMQLVVY